MIGLDDLIRSRFLNKDVNKEECGVKKNLVDKPTFGP